MPYILFPFLARDRSNDFGESLFQPALGQLCWRAPFGVERLFYANDDHVAPNDSLAESRRNASAAHTTSAPKPLQR